MPISQDRMIRVIRAAKHYVTAHENLTALVKANLMDEVANANAAIAHSTDPAIQATLETLLAKLNQISNFLLDSTLSAEELGNLLYEERHFATHAKRNVKMAKYNRDRKASLSPPQAGAVSDIPQAATSAPSAPALLTQLDTLYLNGQISPSEYLSSRPPSTRPDKSDKLEGKSYSPEVLRTSRPSDEELNAPPPQAEIGKDIF